MQAGLTLYRWQRLLVPTGLRFNNATLITMTQKYFIYNYILYNGQQFETFFLNPCLSNNTNVPNTIWKTLGLRVLFIYLLITDNVIYFNFALIVNYVLLDLTHTWTKQN